MLRSEKRKQYEREYYAKNKEHIQRKARERWLENQEESRARCSTWDRNNWENKLWRGAKTSARNKNRPFNIEQSDIIIPEVCPILGIPLYKGNHPEYYPGHGYTASLDCKNPDLGYTKGNIWVISWMANKMKQDAKKDVLRLFCLGVLQNMDDGVL